MFTKDTVIILGAGASCHYGYPTGEKLIDMINDKASEIIQAYRDERDYGPSDTNPKHLQDEKSFTEFLFAIDQLKIRIEQVRPLVIDFFLGVIDQKLADICKLLIAMVLFDCEKKNTIQPKDYNKNDWVRLIVHHLIIGCEQSDDILKNAITFITFNYDLSLESRLYVALDGMDKFKKIVNRQFKYRINIFIVSGIDLRDRVVLNITETELSFLDEINCSGIGMR